MTEPDESAPEVPPRWPWWVGALAQIAVAAVVLGLIGQLWFDGWTDLYAALGGSRARPWARSRRGCSGTSGGATAPVGGRAAGRRSAGTEPVMCGQGGFLGENTP